MTMFIEDFERSENSDEIFAVIGRALVIATRFDSTCKALARATDLKLHAYYGRVSDEDFDALAERILKRYSALNDSINKLCLPDDLSTVLHDARKARNEIAHDLAIGMEGCLDANLNVQEFMKTLSVCVKTLAYGDALASMVLQRFNGDRSVHSEFINTYMNKIVHWVMER